MSEPIHVPTTLCVIVWAERVSVYNPGTPDENIVKKRSHETVLVTARTVDELIAGLTAALDLQSPDALFRKGQITSRKP